MTRNRAAELQVMLSSMNSSDRVVYLKDANAKNKSVNAPHARGERILSINDVPQTVSKNQSLADLRSTKQQSLMQ